MAGPRDGRGRWVPFPEEEAEERPETAPAGLLDEVDSFLGRRDRDDLALPWRDAFLSRPAGRMLGPWEVGFFASEALLYDDNVASEHHDEDGEVFSRTLAGVTVSREGTEFATDLVLAGEVEGHGENEDRNAVGGSAALGVVWDLHPGYVRIGDTFSSTREGVLTRGAGGPVEESLPGHVRRRTNDASIHVGTRAEPTGFEVGYRHRMTDHGGGVRDLDTREHLFEASATRAFSPVFRASVEASHGRIEYVERERRPPVAFPTTPVASSPRGAADRAHHWSAGVSAHWEVTPKTEVAAGARCIAVAEHGGADDRRYSTIGGDVQVNWRPTAKTSLAVGLAREILPALAGGYQRADRGWLSARWSVSDAWSVGAGLSGQRSSPSSGGESRQWTTTLHMGYRIRDGLDLGLVWDRVALSAEDGGRGYRAQRVGLLVSAGF